MKKERFDQLFEMAVENAINSSEQLIEMKKRFIQIENNEKKSIFQSHENTQVELMMSLGNRAAFMDNEQIATNSLPVTDETIMLFLNSDDDSDEEES
jgi:hypothetical protein